MLQKITGIEYLSNSKYSLNTEQHKIASHYHNLAPLDCDTINFRGMSLPSQYKSSFDYLAAESIKNTKKWQIDPSMLSASNIKTAMEKLFKLNKVFGPYQESIPSKITWKNYIPEDVRIYCTDKINEARIERLKQWQDFLTNPAQDNAANEFPELIEEIRKDNSLRFIIWQAVNSEIKASNRHIPVPFDIKALDETVRYFKNIDPVFRAVSCAGISFLDMYTHRLRDNLLMEKGLSGENTVWVRIPSLKKDLANKEKNIQELEILSYKNWCTRSSLDKAEAALEDGDFYIYLSRDDKKLWHSIIGMASSRGKIDQIQGRENNNLIPLGEVQNIKKFIKEKGLQCHSGICPEGPKALQQILIAEKLSETDPKTGKTLLKAIKDKDNIAIFNFLGQKVEITPENKLIINTYKPQALLNGKSGITVPCSYIGINEDILLKDVEIINGDFILQGKNPLYNSEITEFPRSLKKVKGKIQCTKKQYELFKDDMLRVVEKPSQIVINDSER